MPIMNGGEVTKQLRQKYHYNGLIVGLTGNMMTEQIDLYMKCGLDGILGKPVTLSKIKHFIDSIHYSCLFPSIFFPSWISFLSKRYNKPNINTPATTPTDK